MYLAGCLSYLWRTIKQEEVYLNEYVTQREARQGLSSYLRFYNEERVHQSLDYGTPAEVYFQEDQPSSDITCLSKDPASEKG